MACVVRAAARIVVKNVCEGVRRPTAMAGVLVKGGIEPKTRYVIGCEGVAHRKAKGSGGGMTGVTREPLTGVRVDIRFHGCCPQRVIGPVRGLGEGIFVGVCNVPKKFSSLIRTRSLIDPDWRFMFLP